jgi:hypothetical protein
LLLVVGVAVTGVAGTIYFADNFQSGLGQWEPGSGGVITNDTTYGPFLTFDRLWAGGDIFSTSSVPAGAYLSFDCKGFGGFIGVAGETGWHGCQRE